MGQALKTVIAGAGVACAMLVVGACEDEGPAERLGESINESAEELGEAIEEAGGGAGDDTK
jgi:hypothetical protein